MLRLKDSILRLLGLCNCAYSGRSQHKLARNKILPQSRKARSGLAGRARTYTPAVQGFGAPFDAGYSGMFDSELIDAARELSMTRFVLLLSIVVSSAIVANIAAPAAACPNPPNCDGVVK